MVEWLLGHQQQVFAVSWRNPDAAQGHFDLDTYAQAVLEARDAVAEITGRPAVNVNAACSGGIITACALGHLAAIGEQDKIGALTMMVCALDQARMGTAGAFASREAAAAAVAESARKGYIDGQALAGVFAWLRPNDLIWNYFINNYLLGKEPPAFDILYWNQDIVRLAAGLHRDFVRIALGNALTIAGEVEVLGARIDLGEVTRDTYTIAGLNDHIVPWENAYRSAQLLGGSQRFVLSTSGHIQALVNPPGAESRATYRAANDPETTADAWAQAADGKPGSWWPDYRDWLTARAGELGPAPKTLGGGKHKGVGQGPGHLRTCRLIAHRRPSTRRRAATPVTRIVSGSSSAPIPCANAGWAARWLKPGGRSSWLVCSATRCGAGRGPARRRPSGRVDAGFLGGDQTLSVIAAWLRRLGYRPRLCGFVTNAGCSDRTLDRVERRVEGLWRTYGRRVALIGHSRGGHFARALAARRPDRVSHAISMGADLQGMFGASTPTLFAVEIARRVVRASGRARREACLSRPCGCPFSHDFARAFPFEQVRLTSIYSKGDGVVRWQCQVIPHADCVEVTGSHVGLLFNRTVYRAVASALELAELPSAPA